MLESIALKKRFLSNSSPYEIGFLLLGLLIQIVVFAETQSTVLSLISGLCGIFSVVLCAQRKISQFVFSFAQVITYTVIVLNAKLYGEVVENIFYFVTMIVGMGIWMNGYDTDKQEISVKTLGIYQNASVAFLTLMGIIVMYLVLRRTDDPQPFLDAVSTVPAFTAQILMMLKYKENWWYWLTIDIAALFLWYNASNPLMLAQYAFWTLNCIYGMVKWRN